MSKRIKIACRDTDSAPLSDLKEFQGDLKSLSKEAYEQLKDSLVRHGITMPIFVWNNEGQLHILDGHQRKRTYLAMMEEGYDFPDAIPIVTVDAPTIDEAKQILLTMVTQYGKVEREGLYRYMHDANIDFKVIEDRYRLPDTNLESFRIEFIDDNTVAPAGCDEDEAPEPPKECKVKLGDVFVLGNHRLMCGDSTSIDAVEKLMNGKKADMVFTSPPYNGDTHLDYGNGNNKALYENSFDSKTSQDYIGFCHDVLNNIFLVTEGFVFWNVNYNAKSRFEYIKSIYPFIERLWETIVWKKTGMPVPSGLTRNCEFIFCFKNGAKKKHLNKEFETEFNLWDISNIGSQTKEHRACFPVGLPQKAIELVCESNDLVYEPFGGSGTTLIACEKTNRKCHVMELDPNYCAVILNRFEKFSNKKTYLLNEDGTQTEWATL